MSSKKVSCIKKIPSDVREALDYFFDIEPLLATALLQSYESSRCLTIPTPKTPDKFAGQLYGSIISQQISVKAADAIEKRFLSLVGDIHDCHKIFALSDEQLKSIGLSWQKASYIKSIAEHESNGSVDFEHLDTLSDEEVVQELTKIKGVGRWTAEMFLIFTLARPNVFSAGDLGLLRAAQKLFTMPTMTKEQLHERSVSWSPYRSVAALTLWHTLDNKPN